ncbi:OLC1v1030202C1 [Oldenlandia corymbosa var. corymbosa]|uniref:OLC1v1030202C1 n=1 Tax=Oldenlandia corymbosa var. corymbosa TaxID=529605 RepID=A0AAV1CIY5_OLDCO|nr:OLC1v1030202C1 [Oldenlandia corymbosa var. corymbosa]
MESSDAIRLGSFRFSNSNVWANTSTEVFSKSSRDDQDDEEALKWATIERLPTYLRIRTGVLIPEEDGPPREVDVKHLGPAERKHILNRVLHEGEDNEEFLLKLKQRIAREC